MRLAQPMDVDSESSDVNKVEETKINITGPLTKQAPDVNSEKKNNANFLMTPQSKRSSIRRPQSSLKRPRASTNAIREVTPSLPSGTLSPISSTSSSKSSSPLKNQNEQLTQSGIRRPRLSISRPKRTGLLF